MSFPFSVLQTKKEKIFIKTDNFDVENTSNIYEVTFDKKINDFLSLNFHVVNPVDIQFIKNNQNAFFYCNIMILILTLNCRADPNFQSSIHMEKYTKKLLEGISNNEQQSIIERINIQIAAYNTLIDNIIKESI